MEKDEDQEKDNEKTTNNNDGASDEEESNHDNSQPFRDREDLKVAIAETESDLMHHKRALLHLASSADENDTDKPTQQQSEQEGDELEAQKNQLAVGFGIPEERVLVLKEESTSTRSAQGGGNRTTRSRPTSVTELRTNSGVLVERPEGLHRASEGIGAPGAHPVHGPGRSSLPAAPPTIDEEQQQPPEPEPLIEASLVTSTRSSFFGGRRRSSRQQREAPVLAHAKPLDENQPLSYKQICTSPKVLIPVTLLLLLAICAGVAIGVTRSSNDDGDDSSTTSPSVSPVQKPYDLTLPQSTLSAIGKPGSPQSLANSWMLQDPNLDDYSQSRQRQRFALATFHYATGGESWTDRGNWLNHSVSECFWGLRAVENEGYAWDDDFITEKDFEAVWQANHEEIVTYLAEEDQVLACSTDDVLLNLILVPNNLDGTLPVELFLFLPEMRFLELAWNPLLKGTIPTEIGLSLQLVVLSTYDCSLQGPLPSEIGGLHRLTMLDVDHNQLTGNIPTEVGLMSKLGHLWLGTNQLSGTIPSELGQIERLVTLDLKFNRLKGSIPTELLRMGSPLHDIRLSDTAMDGTLPTELENLSDLDVLMLNDCGLTGSLPNLTAWPRLRKLTLERNELTGSIPSEVGRLSLLQDFQLSRNQISGSIPSEMGALHKLSEIHLDGNEFTGSLPSTLGLARSTITLDASHNPLLTGAIPSQLGLLGFLEKLFLEETGITGAVPAELCQKEEDGFLKLEVDCELVECCSPRTAP